MCYSNLRLPDVGDYGGVPSLEAAPHLQALRVSRPLQLQSILLFSVMWIVDPDPYHFGLPELKHYICDFFLSFQIGIFPISRSGSVNHGHESESGPISK